VPRSLAARYSSRRFATASRVASRSSWIGVPFST
jgi:hypothetical protein